MSKQFYVCDAVLSTNPAYLGYVASIVNDPLYDNEKESINMVTLTDPTTGQPAIPWALAIVGSLDHAKFTIQGINRMPDVPKDIVMNALENAALNQMRARLLARGITVDTGPQRSMREVLNSVGSLLQPGFNVDSFDVQDGL